MNIPFRLVILNEHSGEQKITIPKCKGAGIMVSDFMCEKCGYLRLIEEEYKATKIKYLELKKKCARSYLEYGESKEGYWISEKFMNQIKEAAIMAGFKHPKEGIRSIAWVFDHSSCHSVYRDDALNAYKLK